MTAARGLIARARRRRLGGVVLAAAAAAVTLAAPADALLTPAAQPPSDSTVEDSYIVVYKPSVAAVRTATERRQAALGFQRQHLYRHAIDGFSATLSPEQVRRLRADPEVDFVSVNRRFEQSEMVALAAGEAVPPTGVRRILAATSTTVRQAAGVGVAVIDSGIDLANSDLNAAHGTNCIDPGSPAQDAPDGHGTHVAGTIGARNNGAGVTGVAPGTRMYAVKVFDDAGRASTATALCGLEWVTANSSALNIRVANLSFGNSEGDPVRPCRATTDALHRAICSSTAAGVHHVVAAGNDAVGFDHSREPTVPAAYPQVLTVTAISDGDGNAGGSGAPACRSAEADESAASFSNAAITAQGAAHTIAAPGVCITSTLPGGGYGTLSGTSFAAPHVAGLVALCINENGASGPCTGKTAAQVVDHMRSDADTYNRANPGYGFAGDPLRPAPGAAFYGFLARAPAPAVDAPPPAAQRGVAPSPAPAPAPPPPPPPPPPRIASASAPAPQAPAGDTAAPSAILSGSVSQKLRGAVAFTLSCPAEPCRATTTGRTGVPKLGRMKARTYRLKAVTTAIARGAKATVKVKLGGSARARIRRALRAGKPISVQLSVRVADSAGNARTLHRQITLRL